MTDSKILPCPFCGREPYIEGSGEGQRGLMIHCVTDGCANPSVSYYDHASALRVWNRRNDAPTMAAFGASEAACYKWPDDTAEARACRAAYCEGAGDALAGDREQSEPAKDKD